MADDKIPCMKVQQEHSQIEGKEKLLSGNKQIEEIYFFAYSLEIDLIQLKNPNRYVRKSRRSITFLP